MPHSISMYFLSLENIPNNLYQNISRENLTYYGVESTTFGRKIPWMQISRL